MTRLPIIFAIAVLSFVICPFVHAQEEPDSTIEIRSLHEGAHVTYDLRNKTATGTNGIFIDYKNTVLVADSVSVDEDSGEAIADGKVRIQQGEQMWAGEHMRYNFMTHQMISEQFRSGKSPVFMEGKGLHGDIVSNKMESSVYNATNALITTDDVSKPFIRLRASRMKITPGKRLEAWNAVLYAGDVPTFYFPYYSRNLGPRANNFNFIPGYRSTYGPFILGDYTWFLNEQLDGKLHLDYREKRGPGTGPDLNYHLGRWGDGTLSYYYTHDDDARTNFVNAPVFENRQRLYFSYLGTPYTNLEVRSLVNYQSDAGVLRDFFMHEYRENPQPDTFVEADKLWQNFSLDALTRVRVDNFYDTVERLPDIRLTGFQQQIWNTPFYYDSESSVGYYRRVFAITNTPSNGTNNFQAARADTYHQITLPRTFFGWLNIAPRAGGRFTYYSAAGGPAGVTDEENRGVFNTGAEVTFKLSRLWPTVKNDFFDLNGLRHIIEPSLNYVYVPRPNVQPPQLPQFDYELPSLTLLPINFPEYNSIDSIDSQNVMRFGLRNRLQTKRDGQVQDLLDWQLFTDWRLKPNTNQQTFADLYSDVSFFPRSWIKFESQTRLNVNDGQWRMLLYTMTLQPNDVWSWTLGYFFVRTDNSPSPTALGPGESVITSGLFYRLNENWSTRFVHHYDIRNGRMQEQYYSIYRDLRSWTAALTGGVRNNGMGPLDYSLVFTFSFKAMPKFAVGGDSVRPYSLLGRD